MCVHRKVLLESKYLLAGKGKEKSCPPKDSSLSR